MIFFPQILAPRQFFFAKKLWAVTIKWIRMSNYIRITAMICKTDSGINSTTYVSWFPNLIACKCCNVAVAKAMNFSLSSESIPISSKEKIKHLATNTASILRIAFTLGSTSVQCVSNCKTVGTITMQAIPIKCLFNHAGGEGLIDD
ncbi:hypothetical protein V1478_007899 [Vespula squamosa]|uniref:Uncharacterized protein n=1 Tax=Vespula squamosa TaxID=30214 RepID=A0ABD2AXW5_VESSQ